MSDDVRALARQIASEGLQTLSRLAPTPEAAGESCAPDSARKRFEADAPFLDGTASQWMEVIGMTREEATRRVRDALREQHGRLRASPAMPMFDPGRPRSIAMPVLGLQRPPHPAMPRLALG